MKKRIISLTATVLFAISCVLTAGAYADKNWFGDKNKVNLKNYLVYEDFSTTSVGEKPAGNYQYTEFQNTKISVVKSTEKDGGNWLHLYDNNNSGSAQFNITISTSKKKIYLATRIRTSHTTEGQLPQFYIDFYNGSHPLARMSRTGSTVGTKYLWYFSYSGVNLYPVKKEFQNDTWYDIEMLIDLKTGTWDLQLESEAFKGEILRNTGRMDQENGIVLVEGLPLSPGEYEKGVSQLRFHTYGETGSLYVDYIKVRTDVESLTYRGKPIEKMPLPTIQAFIPTLPYDTINVNYKGEYLFFNIKPFAENEKVYAPLRTISSAYGFKLSFKDGSYTLKKDGYEVVVDSNKITVNGVALEGENVKIKSGIYCISVVDFAKAMGDTAVFEKDVTIN